MNRWPLGPVVTIGRLPDNTIVIDSPAVSGHHACAALEGNDFVLEDLASTNGTFVNDARVSRHILRNGDVIRIGDHKLEFDAKHGGDVDARHAAERIVSNPGDTVFLDADKHQALLAMLQEAGADWQGTSAAPDKVGVLRVLNGRADRPEYHLQAHTSFIGKADTSLVRLKGWFTPNVAVVITRSDQGYTATRMRSSARINGERLTGHCDLKEGDVLRVGGLTLEFGFSR
ncbi:MAG TPA: FHA domain-containing protein [Vicinamibacterales bacterium]